METVMRACVILHNLIIDFEKEHNLDSKYIQDQQYVPQHSFEVFEKTIEERANISEHTRRHMVKKINSSVLHERLTHDLVEHQWEFFGNHEVL
jgi:hypothetical protein